MLNHQQWNNMHVYVLTMNRKLNVSRKHQNPQDSEIFFKFITMHKLTARIIQCIVPHKLIVLDLLNFCYHKLHILYNFTGVCWAEYVLASTYCPWRLWHLGQCAFISLHQNLRFRYRYWYVILASACKLPLCWTQPRVKVYSKLSPCLFEMTMD